jgi:hypothetical protein
MPALPVENPDQGQPLRVLHLRAQLKERINTMNRKAFKIVLTVILLGIVAAPTSVFADASQLISMLVNGLGVTQEQATGGAGAIFSQAKQKLSPGDFMKVSDALPGIDSLINAAPKGSGVTSSLTKGATSMLGGSSSTVQGLASVADSFSSLGLSSDMVGKFTDVVLKYADQVGGKEIMSLLQSALM